MWFKIGASIGINSKTRVNPPISITMEKGEPFVEPHSHHNADDYHGILPEKRMLKYKVRGINPETNRKKTVYNIILPSWKSLPEKIDGIEPPYEFALDMRPITDRQRAVLLKSGIRIPHDMSLEDATVVISHLVSDTESNPCRYFEPPLPNNIMEIAAEKGLLMPSFLSLKEAELFIAGKPWRRD